MHEHDQPRISSLQESLSGVSSASGYIQRRLRQTKKEGHNHNTAPPKKERPLFNFSLPKRKKQLPQLRLPPRPHRPKRSFPEQCPPHFPQQVDQSAMLKSSISAPFLSIAQQAEMFDVDGHHCRSDSMTKDTTSTTRRYFESPDVVHDFPPNFLGHKKKTVAYPSIMYKDSNFDDASPLSADSAPQYSTPPTTASKLALRPSPLHIEQPTTPSPPRRSLLRISFAPVKAEASPRFDSYERLNRASSGSSRSRYSDKTDVYHAKSVETPPTSPPPLSQRNVSCRTVITSDARQLAEKLCEGLQLGDDTYDMSKSRHAKRERNKRNDLLQGQWDRNGESDTRSSLRQAVEDVETSEQLAMHEKLTKAIEAAFRENPAFQKWLTSHQSFQESVSQADDLVPTDDQMIPRAYSAASASSELLPPLRVNSAESVVVSPMQQVKAPVCVQPDSSIGSRQQDDRSSSPLTLMAMRQKLYELEEDDGTSKARISSQNSSSVRLSEASDSSASVIDLPLRCRRLEIEWKGQKIPILIHENGKVLEGPCMDATCAEHAH